MKHTYHTGSLLVSAKLLLLGLVFVSGLLPLTSQALSCVAPEEIMSHQLAADSESLAFTGTVTAVSDESPRTTIVTVEVATAHKGNVPSVIDIAYEYTDDWGYGCDSGPSAVGETKTFLTWLDTDTARGGLAFTSGSQLDEMFVAELATQQPTSTLYTVSTSTTDVEAKPLHYQWLERFARWLEHVWNTVL